MMRLDTSGIAGSRRPYRAVGLSKAEVVAFETQRATVSGDCVLAEPKGAPDGYAGVGFRGRSKRLHRLVLEVSLGRELRPGEQANHTCHRRNCINPNHLYVGTQRQNIDDMVRAGRVPSHVGSRNPNAKIDATQVAAIRNQYATGRSSLSILARAYGISKSQVSRIVNSKCWGGT